MKVGERIRETQEEAYERMFEDEWGEFLGESEETLKLGEENGGDLEIVKKFFGIRYGMYFGRSTRDDLRIFSTELKESEVLDKCLSEVTDYFNRD